MSVPAFTMLEIGAGAQDVGRIGIATTPKGSMFSTVAESI
jgi:hypothetical protein